MIKPVSQIQLAQLSQFIEKQMGWHYPPERWPDLTRHITSAARQFGFEDVEACIQWLLSSTLSQEQLKVLIGHLTVGETYFFREPKSLEALQKHILPKLIQVRQKTSPLIGGTERGPEKRLKIWSAGCATGEEPYSLAILLDQMKPDLQNWRITILATDLNSAALDRATEGVYREWSFRGTPQWVKQNYFNQETDGRFILLPQIKQMVQFAQLNLAQNIYPSPLNNTEAVDIIFCRNVLMYFAPKVMQEIVQRFYKALVAGGWLIVSPSEASHLLFSNFIKANLPGTILYQKPEPAGLTQPRPPALSLAKSMASPSSGGTLAQSVLSPKQQPPPTVKPNPEAMSHEAALTRARAHANQGELAEAQAWSHKAIAANKLDPRSHYLLATILAEQGQVVEAIKSLKRSLYLDPNFALAHFALGTLIQQQVGAKKAGKHFQNALSLLTALSPDQLLPEADGLTAGQLIEIINKMV